MKHDHAALVELLRLHPELDYVMFPYNFRHRKLAPSSAPPPPQAGCLACRERWHAVRDGMP